MIYPVTGESRRNVELMFYVSSEAKQPHLLEPKAYYQCT